MQVQIASHVLVSFAEKTSNSCCQCRHFGSSNHCVLPLEGYNVK